MPQARKLASRSTCCLEADGHYRVAQRTGVEMSGPQRVQLDDAMVQAHLEAYRSVAKVAQMLHVTAPHLSRILNSPQCRGWWNAMRVRWKEEARLARNARRRAEYALYVTGCRPPKLLVDWKDAKRLLSDGWSVSAVATQFGVEPAYLSTCLCGSSMRDWWFATKERRRGERAAARKERARARAASPRDAHPELGSAAETPAAERELADSETLCEVMVPRRNREDALARQGDLVTPPLPARFSQSEIVQTLVKYLSTQGAAAELDMLPPQHTTHLKRKKRRPWKDVKKVLKRLRAAARKKRNRELH